MLFYFLERFNHTDVVNKLLARNQALVTQRTMEAFVMKQILLWARHLAAPIPECTPLGKGGKGFEQAIPGVQAEVSHGPRELYIGIECGT